MEIKDIKPIPQYMLKLIRKYDNNFYNSKPGFTRFYNYFTTIKKEIALVTVAVRNYRNKWLCKQVIIHGLNSDKCFLKDIVFYNACGYKVGWFAEGCSQYEKWYEDNQWGWNYDKYFNNGDVERNTLTEFNSNNTQLLTVEETKAKIASLQYIQDELKK